MDIIEMTEEQKAYLHFILTYLQAETQWPTHRYLDKYFSYPSNPNADIVDIVKSMPPNLTNDINPDQMDKKAILTVLAIYSIDKSAPELRTFLQVIKLCVDRYDAITEKKPTIDSKVIFQWNPTWREKGIQKAGLLLQHEPDINEFFESTASDWVCVLVRGIRRFRDIQTIEDYLEKRNPTRGTSSTVSAMEAITTKGISIIGQHLQLHPNIHEKCWHSYESGDYDNAILNATKSLEVAVRTIAKLPEHITGDEVMGKAFGSDNPIIKYSAIKSEQNGMMSLLKGMIGVFKNPQSHRFVGIQDQQICLTIILMCSNLLYTLDDPQNYNVEI